MIMAEVLSDETKKQRLEQLAKWGYEFKKENNRLTDFLILHWEDTQILAESVGERVQSLFQCAQGKEKRRDRSRGDTSDRGP